MSGLCVALAHLPGRMSITVSRASALRRPSRHSSLFLQLQSLIVLGPHPRPSLTAFVSPLLPPSACSNGRLRPGLRRTISAPARRPRAVRALAHHAWCPSPNLQLFAHRCISPSSVARRRGRPPPFHRPSGPTGLTTRLVPDVSARRLAMCVAYTCGHVPIGASARAHDVNVHVADKMTVSTCSNRRMAQASLLSD
ncbi:hypothetical protein BC628DRAFT_66591 [Trametes gibbosa]|nr:hypothetical protein BC628DRAFT_66591 [Trametes gibbosa]